MTREAYDRFFAHRQKKRDLLARQQRAIAEKTAEQAELERRLVVAALEDEPAVPKLEKQIDAVAKEIERSRRIRDHLSENTDDGGHEERLILAALDECDALANATREDLVRIREEIAALSAEQWRLIETYLTLRDGAKEAFRRRERIHAAVDPGEPYWPEVFRRTRGRPPRVNNESLGLIDVSAVRERFGRQAR